MRRVLTIAILLIASTEVFADEKREAGQWNFCVDTNVAYLALSAISTNASNLFLVLPLEAQLRLTYSLALNPSLTYLAFNKGSGSMLLAECGLGWHPEGLGLSGFCVALSLGAAFDFRAPDAAFVLSIEAGYQWIFEEGFFLGLSGGGKYVYMDGHLFLPDLKLRVGWAF